MNQIKDIRLSLSQNPQFQVALRIKGDIPFETMSEFFRYHQKKFDEYAPMALFLARDWFKARGFDSWLEIDATASLRTRLWSRWLLFLGGIIWKCRGMAEFESR